jgi:hypothetical protein
VRRALWVSDLESQGGGVEETAQFIWAGWSAQQSLLTMQLRENLVQSMPAARTSTYDTWRVLQPR